MLKREKDELTRQIHVETGWVNVFDWDTTYNRLVVMRLRLFGRIHGGTCILPRRLLH